MKFEQLKAVEAALKLIKGEASQVITGGISAAGAPESNTFVFIKNKRFLDRLLQTDPVDNLGVVMSQSFCDSLSSEEVETLRARLSWLATVENVDAAMCGLSKPFYDEKFKHLNLHVDGRQMGTAQVDPEAEIAQNVFIGEGVVVEKNVTIMPGCVVMPNCEIGEGTTLFPGATLYPYSKIGRNCRIHSQVVIGADGFGYNFVDGHHKKIWHFGGVVIEDDVEIGANTCVDGGSFAPTFIGSGTKLDNHVQIAHNCKVGKHCVLCGRAGLAGSVVLEDFVVIGAAGGCAPGAHLKKGVQVAAMAVVSENSVWEPGQTLAGHPARPLKEWMKKQARLNILAKDAAANKK